MSLINFAMNGDLEGLKNQYYSYNINYIDIDKSATFFAVGNNNLEMLKWLRSLNPPCPWDESCFYNAILYNKEEIIKFIIETYETDKNDPFYQQMLSSSCMAINNQNIDTLIWILSKIDDSKVDKNLIIYKAIHADNLEILDFIINNPNFSHFMEKSCPSYFYEAVSNNSFKALEWLQKHSFYCDKMSCLVASKNNNFKMLKYLRDNLCPWDKEECFKICTNREIKKWIESN